MQILEHHLPERPHWGGVLVDVQAHEQDQFVVNHIVDREQIVVWPGDDTQLVVQESHALVEQALDLRHAIAVAERLKEVLRRHLEVEPALRGDLRIACHAVTSGIHLVFDHRLVERHDHNVVEVEPLAGVVKDADDVGQVVELVLGEELVV